MQLQLHSVGLHAGLFVSALFSNSNCLREIQFFWVSWDTVSACFTQRYGKRLTICFKKVLTFCTKFYHILSNRLEDTRHLSLWRTTLTHSLTHTYIHSGLRKTMSKFRNWNLYSFTQIKSETSCTDCSYIFPSLNYLSWHNPQFCQSYKRLCFFFFLLYVYRASSYKCK